MKQAIATDTKNGARVKVGQDIRRYLKGTLTDARMLLAGFDGEPDGDLALAYLRDAVTVCQLHGLDGVLLAAIASAIGALSVNDFASADLAIGKAMRDLDGDYLRRVNR